MSATCKGTCVRFSNKPIKFMDRYNTHNFCSTCNVYFLKLELRCPCCKLPLRMGKKNKLRNISRIIKNI